MSERECVVCRGSGNVAMDVALYRADSMAWARYAYRPDEHPHADCTPEEQAGPGASECGECGRRAVHQWARGCMACGGDGDGPA